ncbi:MAG: RHS repeat-associated core domain-containing protein [Planctomycetaceae bacterium]
MSGAQVTNSPRTLTYDTKGNMTTDERGCNMTWDFDNMLQSFAANGVTDLKNATYEYDAIGRRVAKNVAETGGTQTTVFVQAGQQVTCEYTPGNATTDCDRKYAYGTYIDEVLNYVDATAAAEVRYWLSQNRQYSVYSSVTAGGITAELYQYDSYGNELSVSPNGIPQGTMPVTGLTRTFTGQCKDVESRLSYFRSRYSSGSLGAFLLRDPLGMADGINLYSAYFVPQFVDPSGSKRITCSCYARGHDGITIISPGCSASPTVDCKALPSTCCRSACSKYSCPWTGEYLVEGAGPDVDAPPLCSRMPWQSMNNYGDCVACCTKDNTLANSLPGQITAGGGIILRPVGFIKGGAFGGNVWELRLCGPAGTLNPWDEIVRNCKIGGSGEAGKALRFKYIRPGVKFAGRCGMCAVIAVGCHDISVMSYCAYQCRKPVGSRGGDVPWL